LVTQKSNNEGYTVAVETIIVSVRKIALHIVSYMTILNLFNTEPASRRMRFMKLRQIPLSTMIIGPHYPHKVYWWHLRLYPYFKNGLK